MRCGKYGHWYNDRNEYKSLLGNIQYSDVHLPPLSAASTFAPDPAGQVKPYIPPVIQQNNRAVNLNLSCTLASADEQPPSSELGPMVENGTSYSAKGFTELCNLSGDVLPQRNGELSYVPNQFFHVLFGSIARVVTPVPGDLF